MQVALAKQATTDLVFYSDRDCNMLIEPLCFLDKKIGDTFKEVVLKSTIDQFKMMGIIMHPCQSLMKKHFSL